MGTIDTNLNQVDNVNLIEEYEWRYCWQHIVFENMWHRENDVLYILNTVGLMDFLDQQWVVKRYNLPQWENKKINVKHFALE